MFFLSFSCFVFCVFCFCYDISSDVLGRNILMNCRKSEGGGDGMSSAQTRSSRRLPAGSGDNRSAVMVNVRPSPSLMDLPWACGEGGGALY